jgi:hypothetical protein
MKRITRIIFILVLLSLSLTGCLFGSSKSTDDPIAIGVVKTVPAKDQVEPGIPDTGAEATLPPTSAPTKTVSKVKPTADYRQAALSQFLGAWKVIRINKSSRGLPWQEIGNQLTFQPDGIMKTESADGTVGEVKYRLDIKKLIFTLDDGKKDEWSFAFSNGDASLSLTKQGGKERIDLTRVP